MIKSILIKNFQSYKESFIEFDEGFNVINGISNKGKSVIVRAIRWVGFDRPRGFAFQSYFAGNKPTVVTLTFSDGQFVTRYRSKTENYYSCTTHAKLEAMRGVVPDEIKKITQIENINIQYQFDKLFLLDQPASHVGKYLNDVLDLSIIDTSNKNINSMLKEATKKYNTNKKEMATLRIDIQSLSWIDACDKNLVLLEELEKSIQDLNINLKDIRRKHEQIKQIKLDFIRCDNLIHIRSSVECILNLNSKTNSKKTELGKIQSYQNSLCDINFKKTKLEIMIGCTNKVNEILNKQKEMGEFNLKRNDIVQLNKKLYFLENTVYGIEYKIEEQRKKYLKLTRGSCPLCGNKIGVRI